MNTPVDAMEMDVATPRTPRPAPHATHKFKLLLKREFWEHKGGFLWAPVWAGGITLLFTILGAIGASVFKARHGSDIQLDGASADEIARALGGAGDVALLGGLIICLIVLGFVVFFYSLGSMYDERKDRSVLFWKSLPVSDASTVTSKAAWALVLAPVLAVAIGIVVGLALWVVAALTTTVNGVPGASGLLTHSHPFRIISHVLAILPLYVLWALPAVGWLMLCSAASRSKPFLWAVMIPVLGCALISFSNVILRTGYDVGPLWYTVAYRGLLSVFPGTWLAVIDASPTTKIDNPGDIAMAMDAGQHWNLAASPDLWIGAAIGIAMLFAAVRMRRWRDDN